MEQKISNSVLKRLPVYLAYLKALPTDAPENISATTLAAALSMGEVQVRKDLALVSDGGRPKVGYQLVGQAEGAKPILPLSELETMCSKQKIYIGIITVPAAHAQEVCNLLISNGIKAIWNFAPVHLDVPQGILVQNENMATSLAVLSKHLSAQLKGF